MNVWKIVLATLVIFGAGVITGGLLVNYTSHDVPHQRDSDRREIPFRGGDFPGGVRDLRLPNPNSPQAQVLQREFLQRLDHELRLTPEQRERIGRIIAEGQERNRQLWDGLAPQLRREMQETKEQIRAQLTPEQKVRYEELMKPRLPLPRRSGEAPPPERRRPLREGAPTEGREFAPPRIPAPEDR